MPTLAAGEPGGPEPDKVRPPASCGDCELFAVRANDADALADRRRPRGARDRGIQVHWFLLHLWGRAHLWENDIFTARWELYKLNPVDLESAWFQPLNP